VAHISSGCPTFRGFRKVGFHSRIYLEFVGLFVADNQKPRWSDGARQNASRYATFQATPL